MWGSWWCLLRLRHPLTFDLLELCGVHVLDSGTPSEKERGTSHINQPRLVNQADPSGFGPLITPVAVETGRVSGQAVQNVVSGKIFDES